MPEGAKQTPAGGSGNSNDVHGKAQDKPDTGPAWPAPSEGAGITTTGKQTGSNRYGHSSAH